MSHLKLLIPAIKNRFRGKTGSTLVWALIVVLVISFVLIAGLGMAQRQHNAEITRHFDNQAYFSAMSITRSIVDGLTGTMNSYSYIEGSDSAERGDENEDGRLDIINWILSQNPNEYAPLTINSATFADTLGEVTLFAKHDDNDNIYFKSVVTFNGETDSVVGMLTRDSSIAITEGTVVDPKVKVPEPPELTAPENLTLLNTGNVTGQTGEYITTTRTAQLGGTMKTLVAEGTSNFTFSGTVETLVIKANAVITIGNPANIGRLIIEDGGRTNFASNSKLYAAPGFEYVECYVLPGGSFINSANGNNQANVFVYAYASEDPAKIAKIQLGKMQLVGITIQATSDEFGGYSPIIDLSNDVTFTQAGVIHLPYGFKIGNTVFTYQNWSALPATIKSNVCNKGATQPFCEHFFAVNEPNIITHYDTWESGGFIRG